MKPIALYILTLILTCNLLHAQDSLVNQEIKVNQQIWLDYNFKNIIDSTKILSTQIGFRKITPNVFNRFLASSVLAFPHEKAVPFLKLKKPLIKSFHVGGSLIYTQNYDRTDNLEFRLMQGLMFDIPTIKGLTLVNYFRFEERFQTNFSHSGWTSGFRFRYRISTEINWKPRFLKFSEGLYIPMDAEFFVNLKKSDRFNDLIRLSPGIGYKLKDEWKFELYIIFNQTKNSTANNSSSSDFILRLRVINLKTSKNKNNTPK